MRLLLILLLAMVWPPAMAAASTHVYNIDSAASSFIIHVGKSGILKMAGHDHEVIATHFSGRVVADPDNPGLDSLTLTFPAAALKVNAAREPDDDAPKVQSAMLGPGCLDAARYPEIVFRSARMEVSPGSDGAMGLRITGDLNLHGVTHKVTFPVKVTFNGGTLTARGAAVIRQRDFGIRPISAGGGTVKVKNEVSLLFRIVATE